MIKTVLFDFGGVLSEGGKAGAIRRVFAEAYHMDPEALRFEDVGLKALKGDMSDQAFLDDMNRRHPGGTPITLDDFKATIEHLAPCRQVYELAAHLRGAGIQTAILSNTLRVTAEGLRAQGRYDDFEPVLLSFEEHLAKPEKAFYELALKRLRLPPEEVLFIDDQEVFLTPARALSMHTILARSPQQIVADTEKILQEQNGLVL